MSASATSPRIEGPKIQTLRIPIIDDRIEPA
jgi:hypothetical protein